MRHGRTRSRAMPVLLSRWTPNDITRSDDADRSAPALYVTAPESHNERLSERVGVPGAARTGLERDQCRAHARGLGRFNKRIEANSAGEVLARPLAEAWEPLRLICMFQLHVSTWNNTIMIVVLLD
jgi:hypothetical protein